MRPRTLAALFIATLVILLIAAVSVWFFWHKRLEAPLVLAPVSFSDLPGWGQSDAKAALAAFQKSCGVLTTKPPNAAMGYAGTAADWQPACAAALSEKPGPARAFFERYFSPFAVNPRDDGLFTGYYEPFLQGSRTRHGAFQTPVYGLPSDLVSVDLGLFKPEWQGEHLEGRLDGHRLAPYPTRAEIDAKPPSNAPVLFYGDDPVSVFFLHIQGSGRVQLDDGSAIRVAYAGQNGQAYTAIGRTLIRDYGVPRNGMLMQMIRAWLKAHASEARKVMETDASFVFFKEAPTRDAALGADGAQGVALTPEASIAVDLHLHPLGVPMFLATRTPDGKVLDGLFIAQDTGGAIRGAVRADIYFGFGPRSELLAGGMKAQGAMFVLLPRTLATRPGG